MTTHHQKILELSFAEKAGELLNESWRVSVSPDEVNWPDLIVFTDSGKFGLEVREMFLDESRKGFVKKRLTCQKLAKLLTHITKPITRPLK